MGNPEAGAAVSEQDETSIGEAPACQCCPDCRIVPCELSRAEPGFCDKRCTCRDDEDEGPEDMDWVEP